MSRRDRFLGVLPDLSWPDLPLCPPPPPPPAAPPPPAESKLVCKAAATVADTCCSKLQQGTDLQVKHLEIVMAVKSNLLAPVVLFLLLILVIGAPSQRSHLSTQTVQTNA